MVSAHSNILLLFGATGDLTAKKIIPALIQWYESSVPYDTVWCLGRRYFETEEYLDFIEAKGGYRISEVLRRHIRYLTLDFNTAGDYIMLSQELENSGHVGGITCYLAVKPDVFVTIAGNLSATGLFEKGNLAHKMIFEKPFGESLDNARCIQGMILMAAVEEQIYRIDHYLGKDMIRNILALRFGNRIFEDSWNGRALSVVHIISSESAGVEERLDYYDRAGAINDMIQSHLLQLMALVAMDAPIDFEAESIRKRKIEILKRIVLMSNDPVLVGQYQGYRETMPEFSESQTETYVRANFRLDLPEWEHTRFILETGKKMNEKRMEIILEFRPNPLSIKRNTFLDVEPNQLVIQVYPTEGVRLKFNSKAPGYDFKMETVDAEYCHSCRVIGNKPEAYVKLLMDVQAGDKTLFAGCDELEVQWDIADRIRTAALKTNLWIYPEGIPVLSMKESK